jgi:hypothetical protein
MGHDSAGVLRFHVQHDGLLHDRVLSRRDGGRFGARKVERHRRGPVELCIPGWGAHEERVTCTVWHRQRPAAAADVEPASVVQRLLRAQGPFMPTLARLYGPDFATVGQRLALVETLETSLAFIADPDYRQQALAVLCREALGAAGCLAVLPGPGVWQGRGTGARFRAPHGSHQELALCHLLGRSGFAQLCHPRLPSPIPLLLQPWRADVGLLRPQTLPRKAFSQHLRVARVAEGGLILFDRILE